MTLQALNGLQVLEVGPDVAAHFVGRQLAEIGADVVKVEPPEGDPSRRRGPFVRDVPHPEGGALFLYLNMGKRGITLRRSTPTGREILGGLAARADIVLWGDDPELGREYALAAAGDRPAVWMLVSPYGASGPQSGWKAHSLTLFHAGGEGYVIPGGIGWEAYRDRPPIKGPRNLGEFSAGQSIAAAAVLALMLAEQQQGQVLVDASEQEALLQLLRAEYSQHVDQGTVASRAERSLGVAGQMPAKDGWVELMPLAPGMWETLMEWMGNPAWADDYPDDVTRRESGMELTRLIGDWTSQMTKRELYFEGQARGVAVGDVRTIPDLFDDPQLDARHYFVELDHPYAGRLKYPTMPYQFDADSEGEDRFPAPLLGQHTVDILETELGYERRDIIAMYEAGII